MYEYEDVAGQLQRVVDHISADSRPLAVGSTVEISDLPGDPDSVRRTDVDRSWLGWFVVGGGVAAAIGGAIALGSFVVGVIAIVRISRRNRRARPHGRTPLLS